jgi:putative membrane-bound dehydrogenase-like protein
MSRVVLGCAVLLLCAVTGQVADPPAAEKAPGPLSPKEEKATFKVMKGFTVELVAAEPDVIDPVAMCFDEKGRLFVAEMRGYPNGGVGTGVETRGRIRCLEDKDGDGYFETCTTFAEGLRFPMGLQPWKGGLLVAVAPDLLYLEDTDGDGKADKSTVLYTGFNLANIQQMVNSLQWGLDNWVYGCAGSDGGTVTSPQKPDASPVSLRGRGLRFRPWVPGSLEPTSSGGQYGLTADDYGRWFTNTNAQHLRQIVLPDHYLRRNPYLPVSAVTVDIPEHGPAAKVFRISPFEAWRVERTTRRNGGADAKRFPSTELVPGGYFTSACSPLVYNADVFPADYRGNVFVCDPANNLVHREKLEPNGVLFKAKRVDPDFEFLASTDNWFRPVHLSIGPDGALYVLDFYREVIETPLSLPDDIKKKLNLESRGRGRIWRVAPEGFKPSKMPELSRATAIELAEVLMKPNPWWRLTAQRMLVEGQAKDAIPAIRERLKDAAGKPGRANLLWTLHGLGDLKPDDVLPAFDDPEPGIREQALKLAEPLFANNGALRGAAGKLADDPSPRVRFQLALSAGSLPPDGCRGVLAHLLAATPDPWVQTAALSSAGRRGHDLLIALRERKASPVILARIATLTGARGESAEVAQLLHVIANGTPDTAAEDAALLDGLGQGMRGTKTPLPAWMANPPHGAEKSVAKLRERFLMAAETVREDGRPAAARVSAAALLALGPFDVAGPALADTLTPATPGDVQSAAVKALAAHADPKVSELLLKNWTGYGPTLRREVLDVLTSRPDRALKLLDAIEKKLVAAGELDTARVQQLKTHPNAAVRTKAAAVLKGSVNPDRAKVVASYTAALELKGDAAKGKGVFKQHCASCHKLDGVGHDVGANLLAALPNKSGEDLLVAVFDPNREVDPRYVNYLMTTADGRTLNGVIAAETPTSVTLRRADGAEDTILRANVETLRSTRISLMPEGLEKQLSPQDVADLFAYLRVAGK